jgi:hypothetical protein
LSVNAGGAILDHCHVGDRGGGPLPSAGTTLTLTVTTLLVCWLARAFLLLAMMGLLDHGVAVSLALANGVRQLFVWGILTGRRLPWSWPRALLVLT